MGRPTLYNPDKNILVQGWARDGLYDVQIAHNLGVTNETLRVWKKQYPAFSAAIKDGKEVVDRQVENATLRTATGYTVTEHKGRVTKNGALLEWDEEKWIEPAPVTQIFWLCNRKTGVWQNVNKVDHSITGNIEVNVRLTE
jgi:transposase-like protein